MTPFEVNLQHELEDEFVRMRDQWFFKWHNLNVEGRVVDVDTFFGKPFYLGGVQFQGQVQQQYWRSVEKYLLNKVHETIRRWDEATKGYRAEKRRSSLEGTGGLLWSFVRRIIEHGIKTDTALRGRGYPNSVEKYNASGHHAAANAEIERLKAAHLAVISDAPPIPWWKKIEDFVSSRRGLLTLGSLAIGLLTLLGRIFGLY